MRINLLTACYYTVLFCISLFLSFGFASASTPPVLFDRVEGQKVYFRNPASNSTARTLDTQLYELKHLGSLKHLDKSISSYFLFEGRTCKDCALENGLFVLRPEGGKPQAYTYPGKTLDQSRHVVMESRAFFGRCVKNRGDVLVFFQLERVDRKQQLQPSVLIAEAAEDHLEETLLERRTPSLRSTLHQVKLRQCQEIPGRNRLVSSRSTNIHVHP